MAISFSIGVKGAEIISLPHHIQPLQQYIARAVNYQVHARNLVPHIIKRVEKLVGLRIGCMSVLDYTVK